MTVERFGKVEIQGVGTATVNLCILWFINSIIEYNIIFFDVILTMPFDSERYTKLLNDMREVYKYCQIDSIQQTVLQQKLGLLL